VKSGFLLNVVVGESAAIFQLFSSKDQSLLVWRDPFLVLNLSFNIFNGIRWLNLKSDGLSSECLHKDLHCEIFPCILVQIV